MKLNFEPEFLDGLHNDFIVSTLSEPLFFKCKKDVRKYFFKLATQANEYLKYLLLKMCELNDVIYHDLHKITSLQLRELKAQQTTFYERLHYLAFMPHVESVYKLKALYTMSQTLCVISFFLHKQKYYKEIKLSQFLFFEKLSFFNPPKTFHYKLSLAKPFKKAI